MSIDARKHSSRLAAMIAGVLLAATGMADETPTKQNSNVGNPKSSTTNPRPAQSHESYDSTSATHDQPRSASQADSDDPSRTRSSATDRPDMSSPSSSAGATRSPSNSSTEGTSTPRRTAEATQPGDIDTSTRSSDMDRSKMERERRSSSDSRSQGDEITGVTGTPEDTYDGSPASSTTPPPTSESGRPLDKGGHASHGVGSREPGER